VKEKLLTCEDCRSTSTEVFKTICPFTEDVYGEEISAILCVDCYNERVMDI